MLAMLNSLLTQQEHSTSNKGVSAIMVRCMHDEFIPIGRFFRKGVQLLSESCITLGF